MRVSMPHGERSRDPAGLFWGDTREAMVAECEACVIVCEWKNQPHQADRPPRNLRALAGIELTRVAGGDDAIPRDSGAVMCPAPAESGAAACPAPAESGAAACPALATPAK